MEKSPLPEKNSPQRRFESMALHQAGQRAKHTTGWAIPGQIQAWILAFSYVSFSGAHCWRFSPGTLSSSPPSSADGLSQCNKTRNNSMQFQPCQNELLKCPLYHVAHKMLHVISAWCVACDLNTTTASCTETISYSLRYTFKTSHSAMRRLIKSQIVPFSVTIIKSYSWLCRSEREPTGFPADEGTGCLVWGVADKAEEPSAAVKQSASSYCTI